MANLKKASVSFTEDILEELKGIARERNQSSSDFINDVLSPHLRRSKKQKFSQKLKQGYLEMGELNLEMAQKYFESENKTFFNYEDRLAECD
ncbi:MAG: CopG family ribbon-helix-helix protein [Bacillota bacterium]